MTPAERGKTGSLATCIQPSFDGHFLGTVIGNFVSTFVTTSVSISVYTNFLLADTFVEHVKFCVAGFVATKQVLFGYFGIFVGHSVAC